MLVNIGDTRLFCEDLGEGHPLLVLHGGPGLDHSYFRPWLDPLAERLRLVYVDQRGHGQSDPVKDPEALTVEFLARDVTALAAALDMERYAVLGHSFGSFVTLQHAVDFPGVASHHVVAGAVPGIRFLDAVEQNLATFEPEELRQQVRDSWSRETEVETLEELRQLLRDQLPFHFHRLGPAYEQMRAGIDRMVGAPAILRAFAARGYGPFDVEARLGDVCSPTLVVAGRHDRACSLEAAHTIHQGIPNARMVVMEDSGHMMFAEEPELFRQAVWDFLGTGAE